MKNCFRWTLWATCVCAVLSGCGSFACAEGKLWQYYIAVDEVEWGYAPSGIDQLTGKPFDHMQMMFIEQAKDRIGRTYRKSIYRE